MLDRFADWLDQQAPGRRRLYSVFIALALLTIPCYASATLLWFFNTPGGQGAQETRGTPDADPSLSLPTLQPDDDAPATEVPPVAPPEREEEKEPEPTLAPRPTQPPLPSATVIVVPSPVLRASPTAESSPTPRPTARPTEAPTLEPTDTEAPEPEPEPTEPPEDPSPTPPIQVTLDP